MMRFEDCPNAVVDGCLLTGNADDPENGPDRGILFVSCDFARCSSNVLEGFKTEVIKFDANCLESVEMCNRDVNAVTVPRITDLALRTVSMSRQALQIPRVPEFGDLPAATDFPKGSMIWIETVTGGTKNLQISDGTSWVGI